jgi:hypothetical protein
MISETVMTNKRTGKKSGKAIRRLVILAAKKWHCWGKDFILVFFIPE